MKLNATKLRIVGIYDYRHRSLSSLRLVASTIPEAEVIPRVFQYRGW